MSNTSSEHKRILNQFDRQIEFDKYYEVEKQLFQLSQKLTLSDWNNIRTKMYWQIINSKTNLRERKRFTLKMVRRYLMEIENPIILP